MPPLASLLDPKPMANNTANNNNGGRVLGVGGDGRASEFLDLSDGTEKCGGKAGRRLMNRRRTKSMSVSGVSVEQPQCNNNPLYKPEEQGETPAQVGVTAEEIDEELLLNQPHRGPLGLITGLISCWHKHKSGGGGDDEDHHHHHPRGKAWEKRRTAALVELSKKQQAALADKQDTIDMLEWQLEQLQIMSHREHELQEIERTSNLSSPSPAVAPGVNSQPQQEDPEQATVPRADLSATVLLFEMAVVRARLSIRYFCNVFIKQMEVSGFPVCRTLADMEPKTGFVRKEHTAFVLDSRINKAFFHCFENDSFDSSGLMKILDTAKRCAVRLEEYKRMKQLNVTEAVKSSSGGFEPEFLRFCQNKTKEMWGLFQLSMVFKTVEEREAFTAAFLDVAKGVWLLHRLAFSMNPAVVIVRVGKGMEINPQYVEPVAAVEEPCKTCSSAPKVEFMIMPGFRAHNKVIKCQVYPHVQCR